MQRSNYLLIDGVLRKGVIAELYGRDEEIEVEPLYLGTRWQDAHDLGPVLVAVSPQSCLLSEARCSTNWLGCASFLSSDRSLREVSDHLREFICVRDGAGSHSLLRFADPLVAWHWLVSYSAPQYSHLLGPITEWKVALVAAKWLPHIEPQWNSFTAKDHPPRIFDRTYMDEKQEVALQQAYHWRLKERLYDWLKTYAAEPLQHRQSLDWDVWLDGRLQSAEQAGLISERSIAIWAMLSLEQGDDFASNPDTPYSQWKAREPQALGLPAEVNLQTFFNEHA